MRVFNRIRKKLLDDLKIRSYFFYALGEIVLMVVGIYVALQLNNQNEIRKNNIIADAILANLSEDCNSSMITLDDAINEYSEYIYVLNRCMTYVELKPEQLSNGMKDTIFTLSHVETKVVQGTLNSILNSNKLELIENVRLKKLLTAYPSTVDAFYDAQKQLEYITLNRHRPVLEQFLSLADRLDDNNTPFKVIKTNGASSDYIGLLNSRAYQNALVDLLNTTKYLSKKANLLRSQTNDIYSILNKEIPTS